MWGVHMQTKKALRIFQDDKYLTEQFLIRLRNGGFSFLATTLSPLHLSLETVGSHLLSQ